MTGLRAAAAALLMAATALATTSRAHGPIAPVSEAVPRTLGAWTSVDEPPLDAATEQLLAADSYIDRDYSTGGRATVGLYVAYYAQQRPGASIHSPLHCLPGTGWEPSNVSTLPIARPDGSPGSLRRMIVRKHLDQALVLYWYSIHGRMLANEFVSKAWLIHDGVLSGRSDASLVRIVVPITSSIDAAQRDGLAFAGDFLRLSPSGS